MSVYRRMDKDDIVRIYNGILLCHKKEQNNAICSNMDATREYHTKLGKRKTNTIWCHLHVESKIAHKRTRKRMIDIENKLVVTMCQRVRGGMLLGLADVNFNIYNR